jgi:predicted MPP superfamily phosphohydrolase
VDGACRCLHVLVALGVPAAVAWVCGEDLPWLSRLAAGGAWPALLGSYVAICCVVGLGVFPAVTLGRWRRRPPAASLRHDTHTIDVAERLGYRPAGRGKPAFLANLPGNEVFQVDFSERTLGLPRLPRRLEGMSILQLSDLHLCGTPDRAFYEKVMDLCAGWEPDLVALTGDIVDSEEHQRWIVPVLSRLRWRYGAFAILGNHDYWYDPPAVRRQLRRAGLHVLGNTWVEAKVRGEKLAVVGHEGPWFGPEPDLSDCPPHLFRLCLSHTPDNLPWARGHGVDLMLAGHTHGGQVRLPLIGSVLVPSRFGRRYDCGLFHQPPTLLHVSRGLAGDQPLRYGCRPEVTRIVLQRAPVTSDPRLGSRPAQQQPLALVP